MEGVIASLLVKLSASHGGMPKSQEGTSHGGVLQMKDRSPRVRTFDLECSAGSTQGSLSLVDLEGDPACMPPAARVLFGLLGAGTAPHLIRTCLRVVLVAVMVLYLANLVWSTMEIVTRVAIWFAPAVGQLHGALGVHLGSATTVLIIRGDEFTVTILQLCVAITSLSSVTSAISLSLVLVHCWPEIPNVMTWVRAVFLKWMLVATLSNGSHAAGRIVAV